MKHGEKDLFHGIEKYDNKKDILKEILIQLEKDTGLDYTEILISYDEPGFLEQLRLDLAEHIRKVAGQSQTRFMHLIYRTDISQKKLGTLEMDASYFEKLSEMVLNRIFQKIITRKFFK